MMPADHTVKGVAALLSADPGVSTDLRGAIVEALQRGGMVTLTTARRMMGMSRTSFWRARKLGKLSLRPVGDGRARLVTVESVINGGMNQ